MNNSQTALDYKHYFNEKFISMFKDFLSFLLVVLSSNSESNDILSAIQNINKLKDKLDYTKIITKMSQNTKLIEVLTFLNKHNFNEEASKKLLTNDKYWLLMPSFNVSKILSSINDDIHKREIYEKINSLHICAVTYIKVVEEIDTNKDENSFNPFNSVAPVDENIDVSSLYNGVDVKNISAYEMLMESIINKQMDNKMGDYMNNIQEDDVNEAASKLHDVLNSDKFQENKGTSKILSDMLNNIKNEVINLKNDSDTLKGKKGVEQLLGIAQKVAGNMMGTIKESNVSVLDIWDATSNLAKNTVQSDALNIVDNLIRNNIEANLKKSQEMQESQRTNIVEIDTDNKIGR
jgi:hypothetical protein